MSWYFSSHVICHCFSPIEVHCPLFSNVRYITLVRTTMNMYLFLFVLIGLGSGRSVVFVKKSHIEVILGFQWPMVSNVMCVNNKKVTMINALKPCVCVNGMKIHVHRWFCGQHHTNGNIDTIKFWNPFVSLGHHVVNVVIIFPKDVIHVMRALAVRIYCEHVWRIHMEIFLVLYGLASVCSRNWYEDWACVECCQGDRCNRYIVVSCFSTIQRQQRNGYFHEN